LGFYLNVLIDDGMDAGGRVMPGANLPKKNATLLG